MPKTSPRARVGVVSRTQKLDRPLGDSGGRTENAALYGVAMLKIAMELKKTATAPLDELIKSVLGRMQLSEDAFARYLETHGGLLKTIAVKRGV